MYIHPALFKHAHKILEMQIHACMYNMICDEMHNIESHSNSVLTYGRHTYRFAVCNTDYEIILLYSRAPRALQNQMHIPQLSVL